MLYLLLLRLLNNVLLMVNVRVLKLLLVFLLFSVLRVVLCYLFNEGGNIVFSSILFVFFSLWVFLIIMYVLYVFVNFLLSVLLVM